jgi:apolipoprotein N-acyltransferase
MTVVVGLDRVSGGGERNTALAFRPGVASPASYEKHHLVPGLEAQYEPGAGLTVLDDSAPPRGVAICKDLDFPSLFRQYGERGVGLLMVPAWDFDRDAWLHSRMAILRGVENGFAVARAARRGVLTASDARGRVLAEARSDATHVATTMASVPIEHIETLYARFGDWLGWVCVVTVVALLAVARRTRTPIHGSEKPAQQARA